MDRYIRQLVLKEIGRKQEKLSKSCVAIVGLGGLGCISAQLLARAGIGKLILIDKEKVELSDLQRQLLYKEKDIGKAKAKIAKKEILEINSEVRVKAFQKELNRKNIKKFLKKVELILDGTDNFKTRFLINQFSVKNKKPWIFGACIGTQGMSFNIVPGGPCLRCFLPLTKCLESCETIGILNSIPPVIASRQVTECLKILLDKKFSKKLFYIDLWKNKIVFIKIKKNKNCPVCKKFPGVKYS